MLSESAGDIHYRYRTDPGCIDDRYCRDTHQAPMVLPPRSMRVWKKLSGEGRVVQFVRRIIGAVVVGIAEQRGVGHHERRITAGPKREMIAPADARHEWQRGDVFDGKVAAGEKRPSMSLPLSIGQ